MSESRRPDPFTLRFLSWICPTHLLEGIEGDVLEEFEENLQRYGLPKARLWMAWRVITFCRPGVILRNKFSTPFSQTIMLHNYAKVAIRNLQKRKLYAFINAVGLSIGIAFCVLIYLFILDERSFDQFHSNKSNLYRLEAREFNTWDPDPETPYQTRAWLQTGVGPALLADVPGVVNVSRFNSGIDGVLRFGEKVFREDITYVDAGFFRMFSFKLLSGNTDKLFSTPSEIVLTPKVAEKYFGEEDPLGKVIQLDVVSEIPLTVTGIIEAPPSNSSLQFSVLVPQPNRPSYEKNMERWGNFNTPTFFELTPGTDLDLLRRNLESLVQKYVGSRLDEWRKEAARPVPVDAKLLEYVFTSLVDIHLKKAVPWEKVSDPQYSLILGSLAALIMLLACINYTSLALTTSASRRTEVGIRKVAGARQFQLVYQFGFESLVLAVGAMAFGLVLVYLFLPFFNDFTGKNILLGGFDWMPVMGFAVLITTVVGLLAGSYPAMLLSTFRPALVLKGRGSSKIHAGFTRPLVVLQFAMSGFLLISSAIMYRQMIFLTTKDLGYDKEQVVVVPTQAGWTAAADRLVENYRTRLSNEPSVIDVAGTTAAFTRGYSRNSYKVDGEPRAAYIYGVDPHYIETLGISLVAGRNFKSDSPADRDAIIVNEALVRDMGWDDPLAEHLNWKEDSLGLGASVIGVVKDYHYLSLGSTIEPMFLCMDTLAVGHLNTILVRVAPQDVEASVDLLRQAFHDVAPDSPFEYSFLDDDVNSQYDSYQRWSNITALSTAFAILISCLGLFGLAGVNAINRTKEVGIRKVMGAGLINLLVLMNRQYLMLAALAFLLAVPAAWYAMQQWLTEFQFTVALGWELFAMSGLAGVVIVLATVSYHAVATARKNPADTLRYE